MGRAALDSGWSGKVLFLVYCFDCPLEAAEEGFRAGENREEVHCVGEFVD